MTIVPELYCSDLKETTTFFTEVLGFNLEYEREHEKFVYLSLDGSDIMFEELGGSERQWIVAEMEKPFGRGISFQWEVKKVHALYETVQTISPQSIYLQLETKHYTCADTVAGQTQFIVQVPDGYLFRFCSDAIE